MDQISGALQDFLGAFQTHTLEFFTAIAGVGMLSMAIIQAVKDMLPVRRWYQERWIRDWLRQKATNFVFRPADGSQEETTAAPGFAGDAEADLIRLATDGDWQALFDLPIEQLCGQMNVAAQAALDNPERYTALLMCLASRAEPSDLALVINPPAETRRPPQESGADREAVQRYVDARNRVTQQVQRAIDAAQISLGFRWKFWLQVAAFVLSALVAGIGVAWNQGTRHDVLLTVAVAILGGFIAPVARDLVASVQQLRK